MSNEERLKKLLSDLGKATLRGVRKCHKCGTYNGSRGLCCKNKFCDAVFKEPGEKRKLSTEACKLITGSTVQVFSVRVKDKGPDYRGFVQLPLINSAILNNTITTLISQTTALCFVDSCERSFHTSVLKCHEKDYSNTVFPCQHIQTALKCYAEAQPLTLKNSILSSLNVDNEIKQDIWLLATDTSGPLVQRVSKNVMAVKCKASPKHPLGYLHFSFFVSKLKDRVEHRYFCSCTTFKGITKIDDKGDFSTSSSSESKRCVHFYACICAFASDPKLTEEFRLHKYYINLDQMQSSVEKPLATVPQSEEEEKIIGIDLGSLTTDETDAHLLIFRDDTLTVQSLDGNRLDLDSINLDSSILPHGIVENIEVECDRSLLDDNTIISQVHNLEVIDQNGVQLGGGSTIKILDDRGTMDTKYNVLNSSQYILNDNNIKILDPSTLKVLDASAVLDVTNAKLVDANVTLNNSGVKIGDRNATVHNNNKSTSNSEGNASQPTISTKRKRDEKHINNSNSNLNSIELRKTKARSQIVKKYQNTYDDLDESSTSLPFIKWLASITERINQTMHFQFDGKPDPLVFHVPQIFFDCLRERISCGGKKKRLPNSTTAFVRKDGVPLGTFTKYTWQITNILHVKSIFETPYIPLEITRSFVQNADGTYELYKREETEIDRFKKTNNNALIKPLELKTYLKVGNTSPNQVEPTPFLIEWIPDILPISKIGELRIRFEFGHVKNETSHRRKGTFSKHD
ncbi:PREDICTED: uncharacterized protein C2orf42 homolog [Vollenhovia emeryi]|uniref:uncharacterized protein C2orf42 homolog n=1 Tax=Vollenhovia emeryi TaxID=411798 RepID=UPI0005F45518|nr:PREDICTED: uncharacterized protein C2orf42 homolog [Vollenhovia emeryi]XP_011877929.1 PREDICTED: uncharacterized protein C2orf42 homolog [Vollenhovia emeryi]